MRAIKISDKTLHEMLAMSHGQQLTFAVSMDADDEQIPMTMVVEKAGTHVLLHDIAHGSKADFDAERDLEKSGT